MAREEIGRRAFLRGAVGGIVTTAGLLPGMPAMGFEPGIGSIVHEVAEPGQAAEATPKYSVNFAVCGMSHDHIYGMVGAMLRGGGKLTAVYCAEPDRRAVFVQRFPQAKVVNSEDEILNDSSIQLVLSSTIPVQRAPLGIRAMKHGKDYLSDKPGVTTLEHLAEVRKTIAETGRIYGIMYSERLEVKAAVKAGELVQAGAIGKVVQTINLAPHQIFQSHGDAGGGSGRPEWFWDPVLYGGILTDIGSHQVDQFLYYTASTQAKAVASQVGNINHRDHPKFQDFGDVMLRGNNGVGYVRVDWYTPNGLGTWGDGRLFIEGTEGYIELRKYIDIAGRPGGNHLFLVDQKQVRYIDCSNVVLPFGSQFISDVVNRTHTAQDQAQCLLAAQLVIEAQQNAAVLDFHV